jgi:hypothetical protein
MNTSNAIHHLSVVPVASGATKPWRGSSVAPIFCDHCAFLAVAQLDYEILCMDCLWDAVSKDPTEERVYHISPLDLNKSSSQSHQMVANISL